MTMLVMKAVSMRSTLVSLLRCLSSRMCTRLCESAMALFNDCNRKQRGWGHTLGHGGIHEASTDESKQGVGKGWAGGLVGRKPPMEAPPHTSPWHRSTSLAQCVHLPASADPPARSGAEPQLPPQSPHLDPAVHLLHLHLVRLKHHLYHGHLCLVLWCGAGAIRVDIPHPNTCLPVCPSHASTSSRLTAKASHSLADPKQHRCTAKFLPMLLPKTPCTLLVRPLQPPCGFISTSYLLSPTLLYGTHRNRAAICLDGLQTMAHSLMCCRRGGIFKRCIHVCTSPSWKAHSPLPPLLAPYAPHITRAAPTRTSGLSELEEDEELLELLPGRPSRLARLLDRWLRPRTGVCSHVGSGRVCRGAGEGGEGGHCCASSSATAFPELLHALLRPCPRPQD